MKENELEFFEKVTGDVCHYFKGDTKKIVCFFSALYHTTLMAGAADKKAYLNLVLGTIEDAVNVYANQEE